MTIQNGPKKENLEAEVVEDLTGEEVMAEEEDIEEPDVNSSEDKGKNIESFTPGVIPQKDLDATRMYLNESFFLLAFLATSGFFSTVFPFAVFAFAGIVFLTTAFFTNGAVKRIDCPG